MNRMWQLVIAGLAAVIVVDELLAALPRLLPWLAALVLCIAALRLVWHWTQW